MSGFGADKIDFEQLQWAALTAIENESVVARQDDERVGLLMERGIREMVEAKHGERRGWSEADRTEFKKRKFSNLLKCVECVVSMCSNVLQCVRQWAGLLAHHRVLRRVVVRQDAVSEVEDVCVGCAARRS